MGHGMATPPATTSHSPADSGLTLIQAGPSSSATTSVQAGPSSPSAAAPSTTSSVSTAENEPLAIPGPSRVSGSQSAAWAYSGTPSRRGLSARRRSNRCSTCGKTFSSPGKLAQHQFAHTGERPFRCPRCDKGFSSKFKLMRHVLTHSKERQFKCPECFKGFYRKDHLKNHMETHNPHKMMFKCPRPGCGKEYTSSTGLKKHVALHEAEDGNLMCTLCGITFNAKPEIIFHLKSHAGSRTVKSAQDKKFQCDVCKKRFFTRKDVKRHLVVHTGSRDFVCELCPQKFGRKDHLVRHMKKSHSSVQGGSLRRDRVKAEPVVPPATPGSPTDTAAAAAASTAGASASALTTTDVFSAGDSYFPDEGGGGSGDGGNGGSGNGSGVFRPSTGHQYHPPLPDMDLPDLTMPQGFEPPEELPDLSAMLRTDAYSASAAEMFYLPRQGDLSQPVASPELFNLIQPVRSATALQEQGQPRPRAPTGGKDLSSLLCTSEASESSQDVSEETGAERQRTPSPDDFQSAHFRYFRSP